VRNSDLAKHPFIGVRFSITNNPVITTGLIETNANYETDFPTIVKTLEFIASAEALITELWTKYLFHGVDVETFYPRIIVHLFFYPTTVFFFSS
jgi:hypothetical protein